MLGRQSPLIETLARETVVVHLEGGDSIRGVLVATHKDCLVLSHAVALWSGGETKVDGEAVLPLGKVLWLQRLSGEVPK